MQSALQHASPGASHSSPYAASTTPLPQSRSHTLAWPPPDAAGSSGAAHAQPHSTAHAASQPSPSATPPSSQPSPSSTAPLPHTAVNAAKQSSAPPRTSAIVVHTSPLSTSAFSPVYAISPPRSSVCSAPRLCAISWATVRHSVGESDDTAVFAWHAAEPPVHASECAVTSAQWPLPATRTQARSPPAAPSAGGAPVSTYESERAAGAQTVPTVARPTRPGGGKQSVSRCHTPWVGAAAEPTHALSTPSATLTPSSATVAPWPLTLRSA